MSGRTQSNGHAAPLSPVMTPEAELSSHASASESKPFKPSYPLTSWADTKQNIVCIAFLLGCVFTLAISNGIKIFWENDHTVLNAQDFTTKERFWNTFNGPRFGIYVSLLVIFHMMEFLTTAIYNPSKANVRCKYALSCGYAERQLSAQTETMLDDIQPSSWTIRIIMRHTYLLSLSFSWKRCILDRNG